MSLVVLQDIYILGGVRFIILVVLLDAESIFTGAGMNGKVSFGSGSRCRESHHSESITCGRAPLHRVVRAASGASSPGP